jgi:uncharacterized membrane protein
MSKNRLEAFSDGVLAIVITIMALELKRPEHGDFASLGAMLPVFLHYLLSFVYVGIYWNNHHHLLHAATRVNGAILWANLHLLFWISLFPFATAWMGDAHLSPAPAVTYGAILLMAAVAYAVLQRAIVAEQGPHSVLAAALGRDWKGKLSPVLYIAAVPLAFLHPWCSIAIYAGVAILWLVPDRRIERALAGRPERPA